MNPYPKQKGSQLKKLDARCIRLEEAYYRAHEIYEATGKDSDHTIAVQRANQCLEAREEKRQLELSIKQAESAQDAKALSYPEQSFEGVSILEMSRYSLRATWVLFGVVAVFALLIAAGQRW